ncbi:MAG: iron-containing alcohol dehydrogenase, partial [Gemmatimonadetes bacterium]|nr:iron-containing alcohol dehydrogenase [Gemmatimonadota bacterium]
MPSLSPTPLSLASLDSLHTRAHARGIHLQLGTGTLKCAGATMRDWLPAGSWGLVCDATTWQIAGRQVSQQLPGDTVTYQLTPRPNTSGVTAGDLEEAELVAGLGAQGAVAAIAVGSGTINDLTRAACDQLHIPYAIVPTAPSMNGYLSAGVALLVNGLKTTRPCPAPVGCLVDAGILASAPASMRAAGYGDLRSRVTSCADWALSHVLTGSPYVP